MAEDEMVGWHHQLKRHEFEQAPGDGEGQGSLACCSPWGHKELDTTEQLNYNNNLLFQLALCNFGHQTVKCAGHEHIPLDSLRQALHGRDPQGHGKRPPPAMVPCWLHSGNSGCGRPIEEIGLSELSQGKEGVG